MVELVGNVLVEEVAHSQSRLALLIEGVEFFSRHRLVVRGGHGKGDFRDGFERLEERKRGGGELRAKGIT